MPDDTIDLTPASASAIARGTATRPPAGPGQPLPEVRIVPAKSRIRLRDLPPGLPIVRMLVVRDLKARYKQSLLGPTWIVFQPAALLAALVIGFHAVSNVSTGGIPYAVFALAGITVWSYFQASMTAGTASIISNAALVRKTACPRFTFPIASVIATVPSLLVPFAASIVASLIAGRGSVRLLLLPVAIVWLFALTMAIVAISSAISVRFRDILQALPFLLQVAAFVAPVGYPVHALSPTLRPLLSLNPVTGVLEAWRWIVLRQSQIYVPSIYISLAICALLLVAGWRVFARMEVKMADVI